MNVPRRRESWHDAYDLQMALWRWTLPGRPGAEFLAWSFRENARPLERKETVEMLGKHYAIENTKILAADPIYVSAEMRELVAAAADSFDLEPLLETDLPTQEGFVYFAEPFTIPDRFDRPIDLRGFSWCSILASDGADGSYGEERGVAITLYQDTPGDPVPGTPSAIPFHLTPWWFGMEFDGNEVDESGNPTGAGWWWRIVQTTLRLMQQKIATTRLERPDRQTRREGARRGFEEREVVVVRLRREKGEPSDGPAGDASYSHRFIVSGHWRNQWYPAAGVHRQIWISPYVKGDEDLPLVVRPRRAFTWTR